MVGRLRRAERLFSRGQKLAAQYCIDEALLAFEQAFALRPRAVGISLHWALALAEAGRLSEAHETMQLALALQPSNPVLPMFLGQIYFDFAEYNTARSWCERALTLNPHNHHAVALRALIDMALGDIHQGYRCLTQPLPLATTILERGLLRCTKGRHLSVLQQTNAALQSRLLLLAEAYLRQHAVHGHTLFQQLTAAYSELGTPEPAGGIVAAIDRFCTRMVMGAKRLYTRVRYAWDAGERTHRLLQTAAEEAYYLGDSAAAQLLYAQLLEQNPACSLLNQQMFAISYEHGDFRRALKHLRRLLAHGEPPDEPDAWQSLCLGELLYQTGQILAAASYLDQAASMRLQDYKLFYYLGLCRLHDGAMHEARRQFARAVQMLNPGICAMRLDEMLRVHQELSTQQSTPQKTS